MRLKSAETMRALMRQENLSIGALAANSQCSKGFISHLLAGRRTSCTAGLAARISQALGVPLRVLFEISQPVDPNGLTKLYRLSGAISAGRSIPGAGTEDW